MNSIENIPDLLGYLVLNEDNSIMSSGGDLESAEHLANVVPILISLSDKLKQDEESFQKISVIYKDYCYIIYLSNRKIYIVKKAFHPPIVGTSDGGDNTMPQLVNIANA
uniref:Late endosomal/lysosomal adaptor and MAPK and MTOR activator 4 n=1 Tax=Panstrongylus lignarius TaxID=156445 RepID=A0A224XQ88_9HEMI